MERLTIKRDEKNVFQSMYYAECKEYADGCGVISCPFDCPCEIEQALFDRLGAIEEILGDGYDLDRLRELVEADRDGRCIVLPCKVGDTIYKLFCGDIVELEVERIVCWSSGYWKMNAHTEYSREDWKGFEIDFSDFGKTVFLTREAAEAALKDRKSVV